MAKVIERIHIEKFRGFQNTDIPISTPVNAIIGKNGTMKTTLLGMIAHPFSLKTGAMASEAPLIGGKQFNSPMSDKFKFSGAFDIPGEHKWSLFVNEEVYPKHEYTCISEQRKDNGKLRFWSTEGREKGMNYIQCPAIYLSLKRLTPLGEEKSLRVDPATILTESEKELYSEIHNKILISTEPIEEVSSIHSTNKNTLGPKTAVADAWTISAGQDNIGRIILAVLSMKRLKEKYPDEYKGSIICIDELESTLFPASQEKLIKFMYESASDYGIQYFFTTHSMTIVNYLKTGQNHERSTIIYLWKNGKEIKSTINPSLVAIQNDLNVMAERESCSNKIKVYCEDSVGVAFCKALLPKKIKDQMAFQDHMDLSWTDYRNLIKHKVPEFDKNSVVILDGDVKKRDTGWKNYPKDRNIAYLPTEYRPEEMLYEYLRSLPDNNAFWGSLGEYRKDVCFRDFPEKPTNDDGYKAWYKSQKDYAGPGYKKFLNAWIKEHQEEKAAFVKDVVRAYNIVAANIGTDKIEGD